MLGAQFAQESDGAAGAGLGLEFKLADLSANVSIGAGGSVGFRHSQFRGILGFDYSQNVIPVLTFMNAHLRLNRFPRLDVFAGPTVGVSRFSLRGSACGEADGCNTETDYALSGGVQSGAHWTLVTNTSGWLELSAGRNLPFLKIGVSRRF